MKNFTRTIILILAFTFVLIGGINAATKTWVSTTTGGTWTTANSWSPSGVPVAGDAIIINTSTAGNFTISAVPATVFLSVTTGGTGTGTITLTGASLVDFNPGTLTINANTTLAFGTKKVLISLSASAVAVGKILTTTTLDVGYTSTGTLFTVNGTLNISSNANGPGLYTDGASRLVIANGGTINVTGVGSSYTLYPLTVNYASSSSYGTINFKGSGNWGPTTVGSNNYPIINGKLTLQGTTFFNTGFLNWGANSMLEYLQTASVNATTVEWPAGPTNTPKSILINCGSNTITTIGNNRTYSGTLSMTAGFLALGTRNLILSTPSVMTGASANSYVVTNGSGALTVNAVTTAGYTFSVGSAASDYTPLTVTPSGTTNLTVAVNSLTLSVADATQCVQKQWSVIAGTTGIIGTVAPKWNNGFPDEGTSFNHFTACDFGVWNGSAWTTSNVGIPTGTYTVSKSNLSIPTSGTNQYVVGHNLAFSCTAPAAPNGSATQSFCSAASPTVASLSASGSSIQWYDAPTNGNVLSSNTTLTNNTSYYASQTVSSCESTSRLAVAVTVNVTPNAPTPTTPQAFCSVTSPTVANLATNGASPIWYTAFTGGTALATSTALTTINYYQSQTVNGCESARSNAVAVTFNTTPIAVVAAASPNPICENNTITLTGSAMDATSYSWAGPNGFTSLSQSPTINGITTANAGIYFLTASNSCGTGGLSDNFADGNFTAFPTWSVQAGGFQSTNFLKGDNANADDRITTPNTQAYGSWQFDFTFQTTSGTTAQVIRYFTSASSTNLGTTNGYYIFLDGSGEISFRKITGGTPTVLISSTYSANTLSHTVKVTRTSANLFELFLDGSSLGTAADATYTTTAFAGIWNTGAIVSDNHTIDNINCIPYATTASLTVNTAPIAPTPTTPQAFCSAASPTVASLATNGASPLWYAASSGGPALATSAALTTTSYYQSQTVNGCESARSTAVVVTVNNTSAPVASAQDFCAASSPTVANLTATGTAIQWYSAASGGTALASTTALASGIYFASQTVSWCESTSRTPVSVNVSSNPVAGTVSTAATSVCTGSSNLLTLTGNDGSIQWQRSTTSAGAGFTDIAGANSSTYNATNLTVSTWFRAKVSKSSCAEVFTPAVKVTVTNVPSVGGTLSSNVTICRNSGTTLSLAGSSGTIIWQYSTNWTAATPTWATTVGTTTSLATGALTASRAYRAKLTSGSCISYSNQVVVTVSPTSAVASITGSGVFCAGSNVNLAIASATGIIQWQESPTSTGTFTNISGANGLTYTIANLQATRSYRVVVTSGACSSITSAVATVTCSPIAVGGTVTSNQAASVCVGTNAIFTVAGSTGTRQWQSSTNGVDFTDIPASAGLNKTINITVPTYVRVKLTSGPCAIAYSNVIFTNVTVAVGGTITSNKPSSVCVGTSTIFTSTGSTGTRQWQSSANGVDFTDLAASTGLNKTISVTSPIYVRLKLTNGTCASVAYSNVIFTDVLPNAVGGTISGEASVMVNTGTTLAVTGSTGTIAWQRSTNGTTWTTISGQTTSSLATGNLSVSTSYRVKATVGTCFVYSPVFTVTVNSPRSSEIASTSFGAIAYPNPFADNFMLEVSASTNEMIQVNVYDMLGKLVENHQVNVSDLSTFVIGNKFVSGVYNIEVIQGTQIERLRVVKN